MKRRRKKVKKTLLAQLFSCKAKHRNTSFSEARMPIWECFATLYPEIAEFFMLVKSNNYVELSHLLQRVESHAVIGRACAAILKELPQAPIYTIHDCIATTAEFVQPVREIMVREIGEFIGFKPSFSVESWLGHENIKKMVIEKNVA